MSRHFIVVFIPLLLIGFLAACVEMPDSDGLINCTNAEFIPVVYIHPNSWEYMDEKWVVADETQAYGDTHVQDVVAMLHNGHEIVTVEAISDIAYGLAPLFSEVEEGHLAEWIPIEADLCHSSVWVVLYVDRSLYNEKIESAMKENRYLGDLDYNLLIYISAYDGHIIDVTNKEGKSYSTHNTKLNRDPCMVVIPYSIATMMQHRSTFDVELDSLEAYYPGYSEGLEKDAAVENDILQLCCKAFSMITPLSTPEVVCKYANLLDAVLKKQGILGEEFTPLVQILYADGYGEIDFMKSSDRPKLLGEHYRVYFSLEDGHVISIRHIINKWGDYESLGNTNTANTD